MTEPFSPSLAEVNLEAIARNFRAVCALLTPGTRAMAVVKADAYGHGAVPVARRLLAAGAEWLGVAGVAEGLELRRAAIDAPVLLLQGIHPSQAPRALELDLTPIVYSRETAEALAAAASRAGRRLPVHVKVDTGMARLGVNGDELGSFLEWFKGFDSLEIEGICSHMALAEEPESALSVRQKERFATALALAEDHDLRPRLRHLANSAAAILDPATHYDLVRLGISLYGAHPGPRTHGKLSLEPALTWKSFLWQIRDVPPDTPVSYGGTWRTDRCSRIGVLPVGYADGYSRRLSSNADVLVRGRRCPVVGRVCMDLTMIDVTDVPEARPGDEAVLLGAQGSERIGADEMAERLGTISYEVLTSIGKRVPRVYERC